MAKVNKIQIDLSAIGKRFYYLVVQSVYSKNKRSYCTAKCICGTEKEYLLRYLKTGDTKSCGCYNLRRIKARVNTSARRRKCNVWVWHLGQKMVLTDWCRYHNIPFSSARRLLRDKKYTTNQILQKYNKHANV